MAWGRRKSGPKSAKKPAFLVSAQSSLFFLSPPWPSAPPPSSPIFPPLAPPQEANITTNRPPRATVGFSLLSAAPSVLFFFFFCFLCYRPPSLPLSSLSPSPYPLPAVALTPHQQQSIHPRSLSLSYRFSSPSFFLLYHLQPVPTAGLTTTRRPPWSDHHCAG